MFSHLYWFCITKYWNLYLFNKQKIKYYFILQNVNFVNINVGTISTYICKRLIQQYSLKFVMRPVLRDLFIRLKQKKIQGYRILCAGRFTRRQIAEKNWYKQGPVTNNNFSSFINYQQSKIRLKYGICGIKIWISYGIKEKNSFLQSYDLLFPSYKIFKYSLTLNNNIDLLLFNTSYSLLILRWKNNKITYNYYEQFITNKILLILYNKFIINILKEFKYLIKMFKFNNSCKIFKNILFYWPLLNVKYNSKLLGYTLILNKLSNNLKKKKKLFIYE